MVDKKEIEEFIEGWKEAISFNKGEIRSLQNEDKEHYEIADKKYHTDSTGR